MMTTNRRLRSGYAVIALFVLFLIGVACSKQEQGKKTPAARLEQAAIGPARASVGATPLDSTTPQQVSAAVSDSRQNAITRAVQKVEPAVVGINVTQIREYIPRSFRDDPFFRFFFPEYRYRQEVKSLGSGFIISPDGYIVTNEHVVQNASEIIVTLMAGKKYPAKLIGKDYVTDIALLKIDGKDLPYCELGDSDDIIIGEWVIALGNPFGLFEIGQQPSVTVGVVSAKNLDFGLQEDERLYQDMIQTDAAINPGNSGGPMVNALGQVIGMNTFIFTGSDYSRGSIGLGFATPINKVKEIVEQLINYGKVDRSFWTGLEVETLTRSIARYFGLRNVRGVIVSNVEKGSPAEEAGLQVGDIITEVNGIAVASTNDVWKVLNTMDAKAGDVITLTVLRERKQLKVDLKLGKVK